MFVSAEWTGTSQRVFEVPPLGLLLVTDEMRARTGEENGAEDEDGKGKGLPWFGFEVGGGCGSEGREEGVGIVG